MPRYSYQSKHSQEIINSIEAASTSQAVEFFAKVKVLSKENFLDLYEVIER